MKQYIDMVNYVLDNGVSKEDRTGTGTISVFGYQTRYDLSEGFPLLTTKKVYFKGVVHELLWILSGSTNIKYLTDNKVNIWNEWADEEGDLGPVYGKQWRRWEGKHKEVDQIKNLIDGLKNNPDSRRHIINAWNVADVEDMALPPCHAFIQFYVANNKLSCQLYQRSADLFLGVPFNIASYSLLLMMVAQVTGYEVGEFIHSFGDLHIYTNHLEQIKEQISRDPKKLPIVKLIENIKNIEDFTYDDIELNDYESHPAIKGKVSV